MSERRRRQGNPDLLRKRRLSTYPPILWEVYSAACRGTSFNVPVRHWNQACALRARFYKFRVDVIEERMSGALRLNDMSVTGTDANGARFNSAVPGPGPYLLDFDYAGEEMPLPADTPPAQLEQGDPFVPGLDDIKRASSVEIEWERKPIDQGEKAVENFLKRDTKPEQGRAPDAEAGASNPERCKVDGHVWGHYNCLRCGEPLPDKDLRDQSGDPA